MSRRVWFPYLLVMLSVIISYQLYTNNICQAAPARKDTDVEGDFNPSLNDWGNNIEVNEYKFRAGSYNKLVPYNLQDYGVNSEDKSKKDDNRNKVKIN